MKLFVYTVSVAFTVSGVAHVQSLFKSHCADSTNSSACFIIWELLLLWNRNWCCDDHELLVRHLSLFNCKVQKHLVCFCMPFLYHFSFWSNTWYSCTLHRGRLLGLSREHRVLERNILFCVSSGPCYFIQEVYYCMLIMCHLWCILSVSIFLSVVWL